VAEMISKTSKEEDEDEASLWRKIDRRRGTTGGGSSEVVELSRSSREGTQEREYTGVNEV
jgi:hypothetical protein